MQIFVKRGSVVQAEPYDPARTDQGVTPAAGDAAAGLGVMTARGRVVSVRPGDVIVADDYGAWPCDGASFAGLYQLLDDVVTSSDAVTHTEVLHAAAHS